MPHEGFADPITSDGTGFRLNMAISELIEHVTRATKASNVNSTPPVAETVDGATATKMSRPLTRPLLRMGARGKLDSQGDRTHGRRTMAQILGGGTCENKRCFLLLVSLSSPRSLVTLDPSNSKGSGLTQGLIRVYIYTF